jgi:hypothetical protein
MIVKAQFFWKRSCLSSLLTVRQASHDSSQEVFSDLGQVLGVLVLGALPTSILHFLFRNSKDVLARFGVFEGNMDVSGTSRKLGRKISQFEELLLM